MRHRINPAAQVRDPSNPPINRSCQLDLWIMARRTRPKRGLAPARKEVTQERRAVALDRLSRLKTEHERNRHEQRMAIDLARKQGASWHQIGLALGLTQQGAQQRWRSLSR